MKIVVAVRCLNEINNIPRFMRGYDFADSIVVSDGGSTDGSIELLKTYPKVRLIHFTMGEEVNGQFWNMDAPHINFVLDYAKSLNPNFLLFDDMDCCPDLLLNRGARQIIESCNKPQINAFRLYLWGDKEFFPAMSGGFAHSHASLWGWNPKELDIQADMNERHGTIIGLDPDPYVIDVPMCLLHKSWNPKTIQAKIDRYNALGLPMSNPLDFAGEHISLPEWAKEVTTRDFTRIDAYLNRLVEDVYDQPEDLGHFILAQESINEFMKYMEGVESVLDVGCGEGFCEQFFQEHGLEYKGVCLGNDYVVGSRKGRHVEEQDFSFLNFDDNGFSVLYSRHSLEHSPFPLITLMEWRRVTKKYVALVLPAPEHWRYGGRNHYFVLSRRQWKVLFEAAGFRVKYENVKRTVMSPLPHAGDVAIEYWFILEKR